MEKAKKSKKQTPPKERTAKQKPRPSTEKDDHQQVKSVRATHKTSQRTNGKPTASERSEVKKREIKSERYEVNSSADGSVREPITSSKTKSKTQKSGQPSGKNRAVAEKKSTASKNSTTANKAYASKKKQSTKKQRPAKKGQQLRQTKGYQAIRYLQYGAEILFTLAVVAFCIWFTVNIRAHFVNGESMSPTFATGDRLFTNKNTEVERYDIITFFPEESSETYLKRVVAIPGDSIYVMGNSLYIFAGEVDAENIPGIIYSAQLPDSTQIVTVDDAVATEMTGLKEVPADQFFVMGDNRGNSRDSRALGLIDREQIEGVVDFRFYPFNKFGFVH